MPHLPSTRNNPAHCLSAFSISWLIPILPFFRQASQVSDQLNECINRHLVGHSIHYPYTVYTHPPTMSFLTRLPRAAPALKRAYATVADASGVKVAGVESAAPAATSSVTVVVKAGSRFETKPGAAHVLKSFAFKVRHCAQSRIWSSSLG